MVAQPFQNTPESLHISSKSNPFGLASQDLQNGLIIKLWKLQVVISLIEVACLCSGVEAQNSPRVERKM